MNGKVRVLVVLGCALLVAACGNRDAPAAPGGGGAGATKAPAKNDHAHAHGATAQLPTADEACAQIIVVAWQGAERAPEGVSRDESAARAKIEAIRSRLETGVEFSTVAREESDAPSSRARGGLMGTFTRDMWPEVHSAIRDPIFRLGVTQISEPLRAPYGWVIARRCPVQKIHTRHILVRFVGSKNAPATVTRTRDQAEQVASELRDRIVGRGEDFATVARRSSEDNSAPRGGDLGLVGRGRLALAYEEAAWSLSPNEVSQVVETEYGFHLIQRVP